MIQRINHVSITVKNLDNVVRWFRDVMGCTNIWQPYEYKGDFIETVLGIAGANIRVQKVQVQDFVLEFIQYLSPPGKELKGNTNDVGYPHIGFVVDDIAGVYEDMKRKGVRFKSPPRQITDESNPMVGWKVAFLWGPEDMTLELVQSPKK
ncbi:MAG: VOC family protein [Chloroflexota bacterium]|nr:MAG: VOC family protein [Chloroflexota bacterium]